MRILRYRAACTRIREIARIRAKFEARRVNLLNHEIGQHRQFFRRTLPHQSVGLSKQIFGGG